VCVCVCVCVCECVCVVLGGRGLFGPTSSTVAPVCCIGRKKLVRAYVLHCCACLVKISMIFFLSVSERVFLSVKRIV